MNTQSISSFTQSTSISLPKRTAKTRANKRFKTAVSEEDLKITHLAENVFFNNQLMSVILSYVHPHNFSMFKCVNRLFKKNYDVLVESAFKYQLRPKKSIDLCYLQKYAELLPKQLREQILKRKCDDQDFPSFADVFPYCVNLEKLTKEFSTRNGPDIETIRTVSNYEKIASMPLLQTIIFKGSLIIPEEAYKALAGCNSLTELQLENCNAFNDQTASLFANLPELRKLHLEESSLTDAGLKHFAKSKNLEEIHLKGSINTKISHEAINIFAKFLNLKQIHLDDYIDDESSLKKLVEFPNLESFGVEGNKISNIGLSEISKCKTLRCLRIMRCTKLTDEGLKVLANMPNLNELDLSCTYIGNEEAKVISSHAPKLTKLNLSYTSIREEGFTEIARNLHSLIELNLTCTHLVDAGAEEIAENLPELLSLSIGETHVSNRGLKALSRKLTHLKDIDIHGFKMLSYHRNAITAMGIRNLGYLENLQRICLTLTHAVKRALGVFKDLPKLERVEFLECKPLFNKMAIFDKETKKAIRKLIDQKPNLEIILDTNSGNRISLTPDLYNDYLAQK